MLWGLEVKLSVWEKGPSSVFGSLRMLVAGLLLRVGRPAFSSSAFFSLHRFSLKNLLIFKRSQTHLPLISAHHSFPASQPSSFTALPRGEQEFAKLIFTSGMILETNVILCHSGMCIKAIFIYLRSILVSYFPYFNRSFSSCSRIILRFASSSHFCCLQQEWVSCQFSKISGRMLICRLSIAKFQALHPWWACRFTPLFTPHYRESDENTFNTLILFFSRSS